MHVMEASHYVHKDVLKCAFFVLWVFYISNFVIILKQLFTSDSMNIGE